MQFRILALCCASVVATNPCCQVRNETNRNELQFVSFQVIENGKPRDNVIIELLIENGVDQSREARPLILTEDNALASRRTVAMTGQWIVLLPHFSSAGMPRRLLRFKEGYTRAMAINEPAITRKVKPADRSLEIADIRNPTFLHRVQIFSHPYTSVTTKNGEATILGPFKPGMKNLILHFPNGSKVKRSIHANRKQVRPHQIRISKKAEIK